MNTRDAGQWLANLFLNTLYPVIVIAIFVYLLTLMIVLIIRGKDFYGKIRRFIGAVLPIVVLIILMSTYRNAIKDIENMYILIYPIVQLMIGIVLGISIMEFGRYMLKTDEDGIAAIYALFVSLVFSFILWCLMGNVLYSFNVALLGLVVGGGVHVMIRKPLENIIDHKSNHLG